MFCVTLPTTLQSVSEVLMSMPRKELNSLYGGAPYQGGHCASWNFTKMKATLILAWKPPSLLLVFQDRQEPGRFCDFAFCPNNHNRSAGGTEKIRAGQPPWEVLAGSPPGSV